MKTFLRLLFHNFPFKIAAVILACIFWYMVQGEEILEVNQKLLVVIDVPNGFVVKEGNTRVKDVTIRGPRVLVGDASNRPPLEAHINITSPKVGPLKIRIDKEFIPNWDGRKTLIVHEEYINIFVDEVAVRRLAIKEVIQGTPAEGLIIEKIEIKPPHVNVTGPKSDLAKQQEVLTEPIDVSNLKQSKSFEVKLLLGALDHSAASAETATVNVQIGDQKVNRKFAGIPVEVTGGDLLATPHPRNVSIVIQGTPGVLNFVKKSDLRVSVDARDLRPGHYEKDAQVKIPADTVLIETLPAKINLEVFNQRKLRNE